MFDLEGNNITEVKPNSEVEFTTDMDLILSNNRIRILGENSFNSFQKFNKLDLSYNQVRDLHFTKRGLCLYEQISLK